MPKKIIPCPRVSRGQCFETYTIPCGLPTPNPCCPSRTNKVQTFTTGAIWRNPATETIVTTVLNESDASQTVTVSVLDWQSCAQSEMPKEAFLCGEDLNSLFNGIPTPFTFTIPANKLLVVQATPQNPWQPGDPCYEVRVTIPGDPCRVNTWGIDAGGIPQVGNTVLHHQFTLSPGDPI